MIMEQIVLEVDKSAGEIFQGMSKESKQELGHTVSLIMKKSLTGAHTVKKQKGNVSRQIAEIYVDKEAISSLKLKDVSTLTRKYEFQSPILFQVYPEGKGTIIENEQLDIYASGETLTHAKNELYSQFDHSYHRLNELSDEQLNPKLLQVKKYLNFIVKTVKEI
jgi:hypothetical protein